MHLAPKVPAAPNGDHRHYFLDLNRESLDPYASHVLQSNHVLSHSILTCRYSLKTRPRGGLPLQIIIAEPWLGKIAGFDTLDVDLIAARRLSFGRLHLPRMNYSCTSLGARFHWYEIYKCHGVKILPPYANTPVAPIKLRPVNIYRDIWNGSTIEKIEKIEK